MGNILVLGASGFVGSAVKKRLEHGHTVYGTYYTRNEASPEAGRMEYLDIGDNSAPGLLLQKIKPDWVIASLRGEFSGQMAFHKRLAREMQKLPESRLCYLSTANVFDKEGYRPHFEEDVPETESGYGQFKAECESMLFQELEERCTILRLPMVWGRDCPRVRSLYTDMADGGKIRTWTNLYVNIATDVQIAEFVSYIVDTGAKGILHAGTVDWIAYHELIRRIGERIGLRNPRFTMETEEKAEYMVLLSHRENVPDALKPTVAQVIDSITR